MTLKEHRTDNEWGIVLHHKGGIAKLEAVDQHGNAYIQFEVDYLADQFEGLCYDCEQPLASGWLCLDDSIEYCTTHVGDFCHDAECEVCVMPRPEGW